VYSRGWACPLRGRFLLRPLEEPLRTGHARRGGGGVDAAGGRLRRPVLAHRTLLRLALHRTRHASALRTAWSGRRKRPSSTPHRSRPYASGGRSPKNPTPEGMEQPLPGHVPLGCSPDNRVELIQARIRRAEAMYSSPVVASNLSCLLPGLATRPLCIVNQAHTVSSTFDPDSLNTSTTSYRRTSQRPGSSISRSDNRCVASRQDDAESHWEYSSTLSPSIL
jgi:hypothetical protein